MSLSSNDQMKLIIVIPLQLLLLKVRRSLLCTRQLYKEDLLIIMKRVQKSDGSGGSGSLGRGTLVRLSWISIWA